MRHQPWTYEPRESPQPLVFLVGQNPGKSRLKVKRALEGNRTGDFIQSLLKEHGLTNVYLTNVCQDTQLTIQNTQEGAWALYHDVERLEPKYIVLMGAAAQKYAILPPSYIRHVSLGTAKTVVAMPHPSHVLRFNKADQIKLYHKLFKDLHDRTQQGPRN